MPHPNPLSLARVRAAWRTAIAPGSPAGQPDAVHKLADGGNRWEQFVNDPEKVPEAELVTYVNVPLK